MKPPGDIHSHSTGAAILEHPQLMIACGELREFSTDDCETVREAFRSAASLSFRQAWLPVMEPDFASAAVRIGWRNQSLFLFAELNDRGMFNRAAAHNEPMWQLGDTFEIFVRPAGQSAYCEFQVTPNNHRLQLRYANAEAVAVARQSGSLENALIQGELFHSKTWRRPEVDQWFVFAEIPAKSVCDHVQALSGCTWQISFGRYDYQPGRVAPVISSTSAHAEPDFHRLNEWSRIEFQVSCW